MKKIRLTPQTLKKIISEEKEKLRKLGLLSEDTNDYKKENVDKFIEQYGKLSLKEANLKKKLRSVQLLKEKIARTIKNRR